MKSFKDTEGRDWLVEINVGTVMRVRAMCDGLDLVNVIRVENNRPNTDLLEKLADDPVLLVNVLYVVCNEQVKERNLSTEQFAQAMAGDCIEQAVVALLDELVDFFPKAKRLVLRKIMDSTFRVMDQIKGTTVNLLESPEFNEKLEKTIVQFMKPSTNSPEFLE